MSTRARKAQRLSQHDTPDSTSKHARSSSENPEPQQRDGHDISNGAMQSENTAQDFASLGSGTFLEADPRPTFVLDALANLNDTLEPVFLNEALRCDPQLLRYLPFKLKPNSPGPPSKLLSSNFKLWIKNLAQLGDTQLSCSYSGITWTGFIACKKWVIISGECVDLSSLANLPRRSDNSVDTTDGPPPLKRVLTSSEDDLLLNTPVPQEAAFVTPGTPDWTVKNPVGELSPHTILARSVDWSATPLGDMSTWSREFRQIACLLMANPHPAALFWGDELTVIYNKAYADQVAGEKHPRLMGTGFKGPFAELWDFVAQIFTECRRSGQSVAVTDQMLPIERHGFLEETFYTWSLTPLYGGTQQILGLYNAPFEVTQQIRGSRALQTLLTMGQETALAKSVSTFWPQLLRALSDNIWDIPFAILYSVVDDPEDESISQCSESSQSLRYCVLEGTLGIPEGHPATPQRIDLRRSGGGFVPAFRDAMQTREPKILRTKDGTLSESLIEGFEWRGFGEPSREAVVCPIRPTSGENVMGFLVVGVNPRRQFDDGYQSFIKLIDRQLATSLASVSLLENEIRRGLTAAEAAALERSRLSEELAVQRSRLQRMAEVSPVGMFSIDVDGVLLEANDRWFEMTGHPRDDLYAMSWMELIHESSVPVMEAGWGRLTVDELPWSAELRLKKPWYDSVTGEEVDNWILAAHQPEFIGGKLRTVMGSITDITLQKRSAKDAETRAKLSEQLLLRTQEAKENELKFKRFSDLAPGGLVIMDPLGKITYANAQWFSISGHPRESAETSVPLSWANTILDDDRDYLRSKWEELLTQKTTVTLEVRMQTEWEGDVGGSVIKIPRWILASIYPEVSEEGELLSFMGCITDISRIKWAENLQERRLREAEETRRAQNSFIDITSHEMRNPLSAILQCADGISTSLAELTADPKVDPMLSSVIKESISSAETIQLCAQHQKSIVDDILTISKLDSNLLLITPVPVQPIEIVRQVQQMFMVECQKVHDIQTAFHIADSYQALNVDIVMLDSSRLLQVLINLYTNAIKFTKASAKRTIEVLIGAYLKPPAPEPAGFDYFPTKSARSDVTAGSDWGKGELLYLRFEVKDSGCGLTPEEKKKLFNRFAQASPRTHVQYGGSGLGLFISRQLTELQGGEIGVASESGVGSTFAFYVKARRARKEQNLEAMQKRLDSDVQSNARPATTLSTDIQSHEKPALPIHSHNPSGDHSPLSDPANWHVLIVEDNLVNQKILAQQLRKLGSTVHVANHGEEALDLIRKTVHFTGRESDGKLLSVILMDLEMPVMDGLTCVRKIREMEAAGLIKGHLPIIAVTANARSEQVLMAKETGMDDVMPKPFRVLQIRTKIEALLFRSKGSR